MNAINASDSFFNLLEWIERIVCFLKSEISYFESGYYPLLTV